ncbi:hypothetical protein CBS101457_004951 [Exobasidium rhododendri]|nr:hypothetical protein CBS101457_004951 [Exobasidium rhododendri]
MRSAILVFLLAFVLAVTIEARDDPVNRRHHSKISRSVSQNIERSNLEKRSFSGTATWYSFTKGAFGACGDALDPADFVVALNEGQYGSLNAQSPHCFKTITISNGHKTTQARIMDACPRGVQCQSGALDMTQSLFEFFNPLGVGVFEMTWWFGDDGDNSDSSAKKTVSAASQAQAKNEKAQKKAAAEKSKKAEEAKEEAVKESKIAKAKAEKEKKEEKEEEKKQAKLAKEKKAKEEAAEKKAEEKKKEKEKEEKEKAQEKKQAEEAKVAQAQNENIASFGEIMETLNALVVDAIDSK